MIRVNKGKFTPFDICLYLCAFLAGLVPRYIQNFKIHIVIGISMFTVAVFLTCFLFVRTIKIYARIECVLFIVWMLLIVGSLWRAKRFGVWALYVDWIITAILFMQILYHRSSEKTYETVIRGIVDALFIQLVIGLYEVSAHKYLFETGGIMRRLYGNVAISMFHNLNDYATFVVTLLPFAIYLLMKSDKIAIRVYYSFICIASVFLAIRSESRGAILGLLLIACTVLFLYLRKSKKAKILCVTSAAFVVLIVLVLPSVRNAIASMIEGILLDQSGRSNDYRVNLMKNGFYFLVRTYGFGVGAGNLVQWLGEKAIYPIGDLLFLHNWYLEIAVTFGIPFFILYMYFHVKTIVSLIKHFKLQGYFWNIRNTIMISFVTFSLVCISSSSNVYSEWVWMYLVFIATFEMFDNNSQQVGKEHYFAVNNMANHDLAGR